MPHQRKLAHVRPRLVAEAGRFRLYAIEKN
jgi:hypothetical protein